MTTEDDEFFDTIDQINLIEHTPSNSDDEPEVIEVERGNFLMDEFVLGKYSDIQLIALGTTYQLHRIVLTQSPVLKEMLSQDQIILDFGVFPISKVGFDIALKDMYLLPNHSRNIDKQNIISVLCAACFLKQTDLVKYCEQMILNSFAIMDHVIQFSHDLESIDVDALQKSKTNAEAIHQLIKLHKRLQNACFATLLYCTTLCPIHSETSYEFIPGVFLMPSTTSPISFCVFLAQLSIVWIDRIISSDFLPISCEFDRYEMLNHVLKLRKTRQKIFNNIDCSSDSETPESPEPEKTKIIAKVDPAPNYTSSFFSIFDGMLNPSKKRKLDEITDVEYESSSDLIMMSKPKKKIAQNITQPIKTRVPSNVLQTLLDNMYQKGIIYTYMSFCQLGTVKSDEIVPFHLALESHWLQSEIGTASSPNSIKLPVFRFGHQFQNISDFFRKSPTPKMMASDPVTCANVQYRLLLCVEEGLDQQPVLKALLQRSRCKGPKLSYKIYAFDNRLPLESAKLRMMLQPTTMCEVDGSGYSNEIPFETVKSEKGHLDSIFLAIAIEFHR
ncbi:hypothetical protein BC833DRAFT_645313 [Globomyces pollinis-pini]|nr:hypothetical protein BC833DRAFT_645313 [Globomyces pollinis-pini]